MLTVSRHRMSSSANSDPTQQDRINGDLHCTRFQRFCRGVGFISLGTAAVRYHCQQAYCYIIRNVVNLSSIDWINGIGFGLSIGRGTHL